MFLCFWFKFTTAIKMYHIYYLGASVDRNYVTGKTYDSFVQNFSYLSEFSLYDIEEIKNHQLLLPKISLRNSP